GGQMAVRGRAPGEESGMSCTVENDLTAYLDGELSPEAANRVQAHLADCEECRATERMLSFTVSSLRTLPSFEPSRALRRRVLAEVEWPPAASWAGWRAWLRPGRLLPSGAALAAAVAVAGVGAPPGAQGPALGPPGAAHIEP